MKTILYMVQKEFIQIFRDKTLLSLILIAPLAQLLILIFAANLEMKNIDFCVVDKDNTQNSMNLTNLLAASPFYTLKDYVFTEEQAVELLISGDVDMALVIPSNFSIDLESANNPQLQLLVDAINGTSAYLINNYTTYIISDYNVEIVMQTYPDLTNRGTIDITYSYWYNPLLNYKIFMFPGLIVILVSLIGLFIAALNFVKEKELGNIAQINVTAIKKYQFIAGKLIPFWIIGIIELAIGLLCGVVLFNVPFLGSVWTLFLYCAIYLICILSLGLFLGTLSNSQQQVMFFTFFFFLVFIILSGLFTPLETMPEWVKYVNYANPFAYLMKVLRMILLKGSGFSDIYMDVVYLSIYGVIMFFIAVKSYRKTG
ncbi:ABC transporter permease [Bacteroidales bacterium OttesenSCG-928-K22]|nr:ABC transporter permease [Bacteroidales bacterium OttesenSCG-928-K22]